MNDMMNAMGGMGYGSSPCANCESAPQGTADLFCSRECRIEYEGGEFPPHGELQPIIDRLEDLPDYDPLEWVD